MYVEEFVGDSLEQTLKSVKEKLGPDAIILKTITNKGLKGALRKNRIQITAAISEKSYIKKAKVDKVLSPDQQKDFYSQDAKDVSKLIDGYNGIGLNKVVNSIGNKTKRTAEKIKVGLDDFLGGDMHEEPRKSVERQGPVFEPQQQPVAQHNFIQEREASEELNSELHKYQTRVAILEKKLEDVMSFLGQQSQIKEQPLEREELSISELRSTLKGLEIADGYIQKILKKARFELREDEIKDHDTLFEFALREIASSINTGMPLFSSVDSSVGPVVTVLISEVASGQSSMAVKLASLKNDSLLITCGNPESINKQHRLANKLFGFSVKYANSISEIYSMSRLAIENGQHVFIDYKNISSNKDETKQFVEGVRRAFANVEVLLSISAIHSQIYNRKIISKYNELLNGTIISHVDLCLNYGALFNAHYTLNNIPIKFFGTGVVVPDDIEAATPERILAGMFKF